MTHIEQKGNISDGYHTFNELYEHRHALYLNVVNTHRDMAFKTLRNSAGEAWDGWFILGMNTPYGQISYHLPMVYWDKADVREIERNDDYDGHTAQDTVERLLALAGDS